MGYVEIIDGSGYLARLEDGKTTEALHIPDSDICRCDKCGSWKFSSVVCHTCQLIGAK
jgi:hypothetical protein